MSVPQSQRGESKLLVFSLVMKLSAYTMQIINNENKFPKRYRWCITSKIADSTLEVLNNVNKANSVYVSCREDYLLRRTFQKKGLSYRQD